VRDPSPSSPDAVAGGSSACAVAAWFRDPVSRVTSHFGYFRDRRGLNATSLAALFDHRPPPPKWAANLQWSLFLGRRRGHAPSAADELAAAAKLQSLAFLGLVEEMEASLCLFALRLLPTSVRDLCDHASPKERHNVAKSKPRTDRALEARIRDYNRYDLALYRLAVREFRSRAAAETRAASLLGRRAGISDESSLPSEGGSTRRRRRS